MSELLTKFKDDSSLEEADVIQLVGMKLGEEEYAVDVLKIQEIIRAVEITIVPRSESYVLGVMNLRGRVIPVIDLRVRFNLDKTDFDKSTRIIVVRFEKEQIGFVVDEVTQVIRITKAMVEPTPSLMGSIGQEYILGICKYGERLIILLDIDRVVANSSNSSDSGLRKKFMGPSAKKALPQATPAVEKPVARNRAVPPATAEKSSQNEPIKSYSQADEVDFESKPLISELDDDLDDVFNDAVKQSKSVAGLSAENEIQQSDLDSLIAKELSKREFETEELNRRKREEAARQVSGEAEHTIEELNEEAEDALSIDDLIKLELSKREAETDELNKKRRAESGDAEKKNESVSQLEEQSSAEEELDSEHVFTSFAELKDVAHKIINGESSELDLDVKGEFGELLRLLADIKGRVDEIAPAVVNSQSDIPVVTSTLTDVNTTTEKAALNLLDSAQRMGGFYKNLLEQVGDLEKSLKTKDKETFEAQSGEIQGGIREAGNLGLKILEALEFQDINEQKLRKVMKYIEDVAARLGVIVGFIKSKDDTGNKQYDSFLSDLGFA